MVAEMAYPDAHARRDAILGVLNTVVARLPPGCVCVEVEGVVPSDPRFWACALRPGRAEADQSEVLMEMPVSADVLYVSFGEDSRLEVALDAGGWHDRRFGSPLGRVEAVATAVVTGRLEETTWRRHGLTLKSVGVLHLSDGRYLVSARHTFGPLWGSTRVKRLFRGYCYRAQEVLDAEVRRLSEEPWESLVAWEGAQHWIERPLGDELYGVEVTSMWDDRRERRVLRFGVEVFYRFGPDDTPGSWTSELGGRDVLLHMDGAVEHCPLKRW